MDRTNPSLNRLRTDDTSYSDLVSTRGPGVVVYVAGQLAFDDNRMVVGATLAEQAATCFDRIETLLELVGGSLSDVVRITTYVTDLDSYSEFDAIRAARFGEHRPASTLVGVEALLFGALIEIEAIAFIPDARHVP